MNNDETLYTQQELLSLGWTKTLIRDFLPTPILKRNPQYTNAAPMKLWNEKAIDNAKNKTGFSEAWQKSQNRKQKGKAASEKRIENEVSTLKIQDFEFKPVPAEKLERLAIQSKQNFYNINMIEASADTDDKPTLHRFMVNYLRHNRSNYDILASDAEKIKSIGEAKLHYIRKTQILNLIANEYPFLADECQRQMPYAV